MVNKIFALAIASAAVFYSGPSVAQEKGILPTVGFEHFCQRDYPQYCSHLNPNAHAPIPLDVLEKVNVKVNSEITYKPDSGKWDQWDVHPKYGDCDDYAVSKLADLIAKGYDRGSLRLAIAYEGKTAHLILLALTTNGYVILDNLTNKVESVKSRHDLRIYAAEKISYMGYEGLYTWP